MHGVSQPTLLWPRYALAAALIVVLVVASHGLSYLALRGGEEAAAAINISGRQRTLAQRVAYFSAREASGQSFASADRQMLDDTVEQIATAHDALRFGGALGLSEDGAVRRQALYKVPYEGQSLNQRIRAFLNIISRARDGDQQALATIADVHSSDTLIAHLDWVVKELEAQAARRVQRTMLVSRLGLAAALLVLLGEAFFIFLPAHRAIRRSFDKLRQANDALSASKRELQTALGDADIARSHIEHLLEKRGADIADTARELKAPLSEVDNVLRYLKQQVSGEDSVTALGQARNTVQRLQARLVEAFGANGTQSSLTAVDEAPVNLRQFMESLAAMTSMWVRQKDVTFELIVDKTLPRDIMLDCPRMERVLSNILSNAVKFTEKGEVVLKAERAGRGLVKFVVSDTGMGMSSSMAEGLLRRYQGGDAHLAASGTGTGLGLAICRELTELMGGTLRADSVLGEGTTFQVTLPLKAAEDETLSGAA